MKLVGTTTADDEVKGKEGTDVLFAAVDEALAAPSESDPVVIDEDEPIDREASD
jgi:hypothetical protein